MNPQRPITRETDPDRQRAKVRTAVEARGLVSLMSETKWRELVARVEQLPFAPAYQLKDVLNDAPVPLSFEADVWYEGDWGAALQPYHSIEWIRVRARLVKERGRHASPEVVDIEGAFVETLRRVGVPHRKRGECIEILGYAESTAGLAR